MTYCDKRKSISIQLNNYNNYHIGIKMTGKEIKLYSRLYSKILYNINIHKMRHIIDLEK